MRIYCYNSGDWLQNQKPICPPGGQTKTCAKYIHWPKLQIYLLTETSEFWARSVLPMFDPTIPRYPYTHISRLLLRLLPLVYILNFSLSPGNRSQRKFRKSGLNSNLQLSPTSSKLSLIFLIKRS